MDATIKELREIASSIDSIATWLAESMVSKDNTAETETAAKPKPALSLEDVRAILANKSRNGFTEQVRELLHKYGANKLSEVNPSDYEALAVDAEVLGNE